MRWCTAAGRRSDQPRGSELRSTHRQEQPRLWTEVGRVGSSRSEVGFSGQLAGSPVDNDIARWTMEGLLD